MTPRSLANAGILLAALLLCNCGNTAVENPDEKTDGGHNVPPIQYPDGGGRPDASDEGGEDSGIVGGPILITCAGPNVPVRVNTPIDVECAIQSGGRTLSAPSITAQPALGGVVIQPGTAAGRFTFSLATNRYAHPLSFEDTDFTVTLEVHDAADPSQFGRGSAKITVLGNYWVGDATSNGQAGVHALGSDGSYLGQPIGAAGVTGVSDLRILPNGNIVIASSSLKTVRVFNRGGMQQPPTKFDDTDPFTGQKLWEAQYKSPAPGQIAISGRGELWVTGAVGQNGTWGIAVFNPLSGGVLRFVPNPEVNNSFKFTSIVRRSDGTILASAIDRRTLCMFDEASYASKGCFAVGDSFRYHAAFLETPRGILIGPRGTSTNGDPFVLLNPTLGIAQESELFYYPEIDGMVQSGDEIVALDTGGTTVGTNQLIRLKADTLAAIPGAWKIPYNRAYNTSGLIRLTPSK